MAPLLTASAVTLRCRPFRRLASSFLRSAVQKRVDANALPPMVGPYLMTRSELVHPRQSSTTHTESLGNEASVYDWGHGQVHALNPTAAEVWRRCDCKTSADEIAAAVHQELGIPESDAVVGLTLEKLARLQLLEQPVKPSGDRSAPTRRWLLGRGLTAAMLPVIYTILTPSPLEAQSPGGAPTLTGLSPNQGTAGTTVVVSLTGTNFVAGSTTVNVSGGGVGVVSVTVNSGTSLTATLQIDPAAAAGPRTVTVTTGVGTSGGQTFTINASAPSAPTLTSIAPNQGTQGTTVAVTLTGTNFVVGATTVNVSGAGLTAANVVVGGTTSLTANFVIDPTATVGARSVTVTTAGGPSGAQTFTINLPAPGAPTLASVAPSQGLRGAHRRHPTGTDFVVGATTVAVAGGDVTVNSVVVGSTTSLTANFVLALSSLGGARTVTVTTAGGTSGGQPSRSRYRLLVRRYSRLRVFRNFTVPAGVATITIDARVQGAVLVGSIPFSAVGVAWVVGPSQPCP